MAGKFVARSTTWVEPAVKAQLQEYARENGISFSEAQRRAVIAGLPLLETPAKPEAQLIERTTRPAAYATFGFGQAEFTD